MTQHERSKQKKLVDATDNLGKTLEKLYTSHDLHNFTSYTRQMNNEAQWEKKACGLRDIWSISLPHVWNFSQPTRSLHLETWSLDALKHLVQQQELVHEALRYFDILREEAATFPEYEYFCKNSPIDYVDLEILRNDPGLLLSTPVKQEEADLDDANGNETDEADLDDANGNEKKSVGLWSILTTPRILTDSRISFSETDDVDFYSRCKIFDGDKMCGNKYKFMCDKSETDADEMNENEMKFMNKIDGDWAVVRKGSNKIKEHETEPINEPEFDNDCEWRVVKKGKRGKMQKKTLIQDSKTVGVTIRNRFEALDPDEPPSTSTTTTSKSMRSWAEQMDDVNERGEVK